MANTNTVTPYDHVAGDYDHKRNPGAKTVAALRSIMSGVPPDKLVLSIGCGTGQYEQALRERFRIIGVDRSEGMLGFAKDRMEDCIRADMSQLPFEDCTFHAVYYVHSLHHLGANFTISPSERDEARVAALREAVRVMRSGPLSIVQRDHCQNKAVWFWRYFPKALERRLVIQPQVATIAEWLTVIGLDEVTATPVEDSLIDGFYDARAPLDPAFRRAYSDFSFLTPKELDAGLASLGRAISSGSVHAEIERSQKSFEAIGGTVFVVSASKTEDERASTGVS